MARMKVRKGRRSPMVMHKGEMIRQQQARMKWFLNFLNTDINSLNPVELWKLFLDFDVFFYEEPFVLNFWPKRELLQEKRFLNLYQDFLNVCQDYLRSLLDELLIAQESDDLWQPRFEYLLSSYYFFMHDDKIHKVNVLPPPSDLVPNLPKHLHEEGEIGNHYRGMLCDAFIKTLSPFRPSRIKICQKPDCGKYFYQKTTKSKGDFCSPKCRNWAATKKWRKKHNHEWKVYMRTYQRERRDKTKQDQVEVHCGACGFRESKGLLEDYLKSYSGPQNCPRCKKTKLWHIVSRWDKKERDWVREPYDEKEWNRYLRETQKTEG
ncbi:MAG: CGNR zinc finger domain-containing protein [Candidatus Hodarchaeota archaeon]